MTAPVLAIDGPSGSGKGAVGQRVAARLGWHFLDSGALYRAVGLAAHQAGIPLDDPPRVAELAGALDIAFPPATAGRILLNGKDSGQDIRSEEAGGYASQVGALGPVRAALLQRQRDFRRLPGLVADGRDMGTTVFPDAVLKIFLTASAEVRAERRYKQLKEKGFDVNLPRLLGEIRERDVRDAERAVSPLKPAQDALILDTSNLSIDEVVEHILGHLPQQFASPGR